MTKKQYGLYYSMGITQMAVPQQIIEQLANRLLQSLYKPVKDDRQWVADPPENLRDEPINWGDLSATVEPRGEGWYKIIIEEAAPGECPNLCEYIRSYLEAWGWVNVDVVTEW